MEIIVPVLAISLWVLMMLLNHRERQSASEEHALRLHQHDPAEGWHPSGDVGGAPLGRHGATGPSDFGPVG